MPSCVIRTLAPITLTTSPARIFPTGAMPVITSIKVVAHGTNTGIAFFGDANINQSTRQGDSIAAGQSVKWDGLGSKSSGGGLIAAEQLHVTGTVAGDRVSVIYTTAI